MLTLIGGNSAAEESKPDELLAISEESVEKWKQDFHAKAVAAGISDQIIKDQLSDFMPNERIISLDRKQPSKTITFAEYHRRVISKVRIRKGKRLLEEHQDLLSEIGRKYGVQPRFIVALWGIETDFGNNMGGFKVPHALATLAYEGRRGEFFERELVAALRIIEAGHINKKNMHGSWAGAMGQCQFMPTSFEKYAVDYNGDGRKDIWRTRADVFASIANYLSTVGWDNNGTWGRAVQLPSGFDVGKTGKENFQDLSYWQSLGVRRADGSNLPRRQIKGAIILPGGSEKQAYLIYSNYHSLLDWNRSLYFATAVGLLSDAIGERW